MIECSGGTGSGKRAKECGGRCPRTDSRRVEKQNGRVGDEKPWEVTMLEWCVTRLVDVEVPVDRQPQGIGREVAGD